MNIEAMSIGVKTDGKLYLVSLANADLDIVAKMISIACPNNTLKLIPAPEGARLMTIGEIEDNTK